MRILSIILTVVFLASVAYAGPIDLGITKLELPNAQAGYIISFKNQGVEATVSTPIMAKAFSWGKLSLNIGGAPAINEPIASLTYQLPEDVVEKWGLEIPYAKLLDIRAGLYGGFEINDYRNKPEEDWYEALDYGFAGIVATAKF